MIKESQIVHETSTGHYVLRENGLYTVYVPTITHAVSDSSYPLTLDGLTVAESRCNYLSEKMFKKKEGICGYTGICDNESPCQNPEYINSGYCVGHLSSIEELAWEKNDAKFFDGEEQIDLPD